MADNFVTNYLNRFADRIANGIVEGMAGDDHEVSREYYLGKHKQPLKVKPGQASDNVIINTVRLAVDRSTSMLFGGGIDFTASDEQENEWLQNAWAANKKNILLHRTGVDGELNGTWYIKLVPMAAEHNDEIYPRLVLLDPWLMEIETDRMDIETVMSYTFTMKLSDDESFKEVTRRTNFNKGNGEIVRNAEGLEEGAPAGTWIVETWRSKGATPAWKLIKSVVWLYPFPPIIHGQNLPSIHSVYGASGIAGTIQVQDKYNFTLSNIAKIIRNHAHPKLYGTGFPTNPKEKKTIYWGPDEMPTFTSETVKINSIEMDSDLTSSRAFLQDLKRSIFALARVVDLESISDKLGQLTNFGLRVFYSDALSKNATRRELYGDALIELSRRMIVVGTEVPDTSEVTVIWGADLPQDEKEDAEMVRLDLQAGIVSRQTAASKRGYEWDTVRDDEGAVVREGEADRIASEAAATRDNEANALARFFSGNDQP